ncbi:MAG: flagellar biosynthetic protein FliO [Planctomycetes bacterium]|nr:flagellar biosynthetic protein FliO [Planctomycetota bacterium]
MIANPVLVLFLLLWIPARSLTAAGTPGNGVISEGIAGEDSPRSPGRFDAAIRTAEDDLARMDKERRDDGERWSIGNILSVAALAAALVLMWWVMRWTRSGGGGLFRAPGGREMSVIDRLAVGRQTTLFVIRLRGRDYWLADHPRGVTLLAEIQQPANGPPLPGTPPEAEAPGKAAEI